MNAHTYPTVITKGRAVGKKPPLSSRVNANTQKKIDKIGRANEANLLSTYHLVDMAQVFTKLNFKKERIVVKKKMVSYQNQLECYKRLQQNRGSKQFLTHTPAYVSESKLLPVILRERQETMAQIYDVDAIRSIRRKRKPVVDNSAMRGYSELQRLQDRHIAEYRAAMDKMQKLELTTGITFSLRVPKRSLSAYQTDVEDPGYMSLIANMRNQIRSTEHQVSRIQKKFKELSNRLYRRNTTANELDMTKEKRAGHGSAENCGKTFNMFCEAIAKQRIISSFNGEEAKERVSLESVKASSLATPGSRGKSVRFSEADKGESFLPDIVSEKPYTYQHYIRVEETSTETDKEAELNAMVIITTPSPILEHDHGADSTESEYSEDGDEEDPRFNIFSTKAVIGKRRKI